MGFVFAVGIEITFRISLFERFFPFLIENGFCCSSVMQVVDRRFSKT